MNIVMDIKPVQNLITRIRLLKQVKPDSNWVFFAKKELLDRIPEEETHQRIIYEFVNLKLIRRLVDGAILKPVAVGLAVLIFVSIAGGTLWLVRNSVPGQSFYSVKLTYQNWRTQFVSEEQKPQVHLSYAYQRVEELKKLEEEKKEERVNETVKVMTDDFSKAKDTFKKIKEPAKKFSAGINLVKQVSKIENSLTKEKENLSESSSSREKISEVEKVAGETKQEVLTTLIEDSENNDGYRELVENLMKEIEEYEKQYREAN